MRSSLSVPWSKYGSSVEEATLHFSTRQPKIICPLRSINLLPPFSNPPNLSIPELWKKANTSFSFLKFIMRFTAAAAVLSTALLAGSVQADAQSVLKDASASASSIASEASASGSSLVESATSGPELPTFTVRFLSF